MFKQGLDKAVGHVLPIKRDHGSGRWQTGSWFLRAERCYLITEWLLKTVFEQLYYQKVALEGMVLKPNMVVSGKKAKARAGVEEVAAAGNQPPPRGDDEPG